MKKNQNPLILGDNRVPIVKKNWAWNFDLNAVIRVKEVRRLEFKSQQCELSKKSALGVRN